jgi:hypothetical protein
VFLAQADTSAQLALRNVLAALQILAVVTALVIRLKLRLLESVLAITVSVEMHVNSLVLFSAHRMIFAIFKVCVTDKQVNATATQLLEVLFARLAVQSQQQLPLLLRKFAVDTVCVWMVLLALLLLVCVNLDGRSLTALLSVQLHLTV